MKYLSIVFLNLLCISTSLSASEIVLDKDKYIEHLTNESIRNFSIAIRFKNNDIHYYYTGKKAAFDEIIEYISSENYLLD